MILRLIHTRAIRAVRSLPTELGLARVRHSKWPKSDISDFGMGEGWGGGSSCCTSLVRQLPTPARLRASLTRYGGGEHTFRIATLCVKTNGTRFSRPASGAIERADEES